HFCFFFPIVALYYFAFCAVRFSNPAAPFSAVTGLWTALECGAGSGMIPVPLGSIGGFMLRRLTLLVVAIPGLLALQLASVAQPAPAPAPAVEQPSALRIAYLSNETPSLDPHTIRDDLSFRLVAAVYETLYMYA